MSDDEAVDEPAFSDQRVAEMEALNQRAALVPDEDGEGS